MLGSNATVQWEDPDGWAGDARLANFVHPDDRDRLAHCLEAGGRQELTARVLDDDGQWRTAQVTLTALTLAAGPEGQVFVCIRDAPGDATPPADLIKRANEDSLTELDNRASLLAHLRAAEAADDDSSLAVLYLDVDHFKSVNDRLGHTAGDTVLRTVAQRLRAAIRPGDTVARIGGDEFVVVAASVGNAEVATEIAERVRVLVGAPVKIGGRQITPTVSVGVAVGLGRAAPALLEQADVALYRAKHNGRNRTEVYIPDPSRNGSVTAPEDVLGAALEGDGLVAVYQPVVDLIRGRVSDVEALMRLRVDSGRLENPEALLRLAEESGLIVSLGAGMLDLACREAATWGADGPGLLWRISSRQLHEARAADQILTTLDGHGVAPHRLAVEVTESTLTQPGPPARRNLDRLANGGVRTVINGFGAGPASLALLRQFVPDALALDDAFLVGLGHDARHTAVLEGIAALGRTLGVTMIAKGVSDEDQVRLLASWASPAAKVRCGEGPCLPANSRVG